MYAQFDSYGKPIPKETEQPPKRKLEEVSFPNSSHRNPEEFKSYEIDLSDSDIEYLSDVVEIRESDELYNEASEEVVLITLLLIHAEGIYPETMHELSHHTGAFKMFVAGTSLARHGLAIAYYENMSFGDDVSDRVVFKKVD